MEAASSMGEVSKKEVELVHPWPEWIELMERLAKQNYFDLRRVDEQCVADDAAIDLSEVKEEVSLDLSRDWLTVRNACMNFGRDRFDIIRYDDLMIYCFLFTALLKVVSLYCLVHNLSRYHLYRTNKDHVIVLCFLLNLR